MRTLKPLEIFFKVPKVDTETVVPKLKTLLESIDPDAILEVDDKDESLSYVRVYITFTSEAKEREFTEKRDATDGLRLNMSSGN